VVNVFASWCQPCKRELPDLARLAQRHPKLWLLGIDVDEASAAPEEVARFLADAPREMTVMRQPAGIAPLLPALALPADWNESVPPEWQRSVPLTFVYDRSGGFATGSVGQLVPEALEAIEALAGK
jgi:thiol-disulfide isomerase/thioredoxin